MIDNVSAYLQATCERRGLVCGLEKKNEAAAVQCDPAVVEVGGVVVGGRAGGVRVNRVPKARRVGYVSGAGIKLHGAPDACIPCIPPTHPPPIPPTKLLLGPPLAGPGRRSSRERAGAGARAGKAGAVPAAAAGSSGGNGGGLRGHARSGGCAEMRHYC